MGAFLDVFAKGLVIRPNSIRGNEQFESIIIINWQHEQFFHERMPMICIPDDLSAPPLSTYTAVHMPAIADNHIITRSW